MTKNNPPAPPTRDQWAAAFAETDWQGKLTRALDTVACSPDAEPGDRLRALRLWEELISLGILPPPVRGITTISRTAAIDMLDVRLRDEGKALRAKDLLSGVYGMAHYAARFVEIPDALQSVTDALNKLLNPDGPEDPATNDKLATKQEPN